MKTIGQIVRSIITPAWSGTSSSDGSTRDAFDAYKRHGVTRKQLHSLCINFFHFPPEYRDTLSNYWIYHWQGAHLREQVQDGTIHIPSGAVCGNAGEYLIVYQNCTPYAAYKAKCVRMSFRKPCKEFDLPAFVVVQVFKQ